MNNAIQVEKMARHDGYLILLQVWNIRREQIIREGKKARSEEKKIQSWARLDGFDEAVLTVENIIKSAKITNDLQNEIPRED